MVRIYKRSDRITVKIDDIEVKLAPLTLDQKTEIQQTMMDASKSSNLRMAQNGIVLALKYALKSISGIEDGDGNAYKLEFNGDQLTDECADDLLNLQMKDKLTMVCMTFVNGIPTQFTDNKNMPLEGVELVKAPKVDPSKKS